MNAVEPWPRSAGPREDRSAADPGVPAPGLDWERVVRGALLSRALDDLEETRLLPARRLFYQFSARGHEVTQAMLAQYLTGPRDAVGAYYRSRPLLLALGLPCADALAGSLMRANGASGGRDIGVVFNWPRAEGACVLPACGGVGAQYTPAAGWAQAIRYRALVLGDRRYEHCIAVAHGGEASTATNGFWAALNLATTQRLPLLLFIEDNGYGISVTSDWQTPGGNIAENLRAFSGLYALEADAAEPMRAAEAIAAAVNHVRVGEGPALLRLRVPRLCGHSGQDTQTYKSAEQIDAERARDPLAALKRMLQERGLSAARWEALEREAASSVEAALAEAERQPPADPDSLTRYVFAERRADGTPDVQRMGGLRAESLEPPPAGGVPRSQGPRINMMTAIRRTLAHELAINDRVLVFGEDVGRKGGVHGATLGLQERFGAERVFDTSLSEEGIIGRAVGLALAGLVPVPEIQFRKYADPAAEQLNDCGTIRWRTANRCAAPMVVRMPGGFFKCGDPWHSQSNEVAFLHAIGWRVAMPSNAEDAVGLLRAALRGDDPTIFFEHRAMLDGAWARRPYPGDDYVLPFGQARILRRGERATLVSWGAMVERCEQAQQLSGVDAELIDLRTLSPWDRDAVLGSVRRTRRCLIVHEDNLTAGFGAEIAAVLAKEAFYDLDAPLERLTMPDVPSPHSPLLLEAAVPSIERIAAALAELVAA